MAKATKTPADYTLTLELSRAEAEVLQAYLGAATGPTEYGNPRYAINVMYDALKAAGVERAKVRVKGTAYVEKEG